MLKFSFKRSRQSTDIRWFTKAARASAFAACLLTAFPPAQGFASEPTAAANQSDSIVSLVKALSSENADARKQAAQELTWMGPEARPALPALEACLRDQNPIVRARAARAVWEIGGEAHAAVPVLVELLEVPRFRTIANSLRIIWAQWRRMPRPRSLRFAKP
jgi:HEAT repeat protein